MEIAKKILLENQPELALERLKKILYEKNFSDEWKIHELIGACFHDLANAEGAAQAYLNAAQKDKILRSQRMHFSNYFFALHYLNLDEKIFFETAKIYNSLYRDTFQLSNFPSFHLEKIHIAFVAPHFLDSSSARFFENLLTDYDREKFFVSAWSLSSSEDNFTKKIRRSVDKFFDISEISFEESAQKIQSEGADIFFDLGGHTEGGETLQIAAYRPAKIQISGIGFFDTTGTNFIDYFLTDNFMIDGNENNFTEKILILKNAFAFKPSEKMLRWKGGEVERLKGGKIERLKSGKYFSSNELSIFSSKNRLKGDFTFGCLNNFMKINDEYLRVVKRILDGAENSKIIFRDTTPLESRKKILEKKILSAGIKNFEVRVGEDNFFDDYGEIDLILDTFPYSGGMMTALAIFFETPVINLCGKKHFERLGADILKISGLENFIAKNKNDYIKKSLDFVKNPKKIYSEKLFDVKNFTKDFYKKISELKK